MIEENLTEKIITYKLYSLRLLEERIQNTFREVRTWDGKAPVLCVIHRKRHIFSLLFPLSEVSRRVISQELPECRRIYRLFMDVKLQE